MSNVVRSQVEKTLEIMESGHFQDFCLEFLPIYDSHYIGLSRFGHTTGGKTRPGTPDLLLTGPDGSQIAVQCGTEENYWKCPDDIQRWKPFVDAQKCIEALTHLVEIVLIANREIPTNCPNTKTNLKKALKERSDACVTLVSCEEIGQTISSTLHTQPTKNLLEKFFPEAFQAFLNEDDAQRFRLGRSVASEKLVDSRQLFSLLDQVNPSASDSSQTKDFIISELDSFSYRIKSIPLLHTITRPSVDELALKNPSGKVWALIGAPKIGKTSLLMQLSTSWAEYDIRWYDIPYQPDYERTIAVDLIQTLIPGEKPENLLRSPILFTSALNKTQPLDQPTIFIIDNAENLSEDTLKQLGSILAKIKRYNVIGNFTIIFSSNRNLSALSAAVDQSIIAPRWRLTELCSLLKEAGIFCEQNYETKYMELLEGFSGGHPLIAKALARKYPLVNQLLQGQLTNGPDPKDENLSREVQELLYKDILTDADSQNLVQRMSILIGPTEEDVVDILRKEVNPQILQSAKVIFDRVGGSVIEGNSEHGYSIPMVFRDIAKQKISEDEKKEVFKAAANKLLTPNNMLLDLGRAASGVSYFVYAGEFSQVYSWTSFLIHHASNGKLSDENLSVFLEKFSYINFLPPPPDLSNQILHGFMMLTLATAHFKVDKYESALKNLQKVNFSPLNSSEEFIVTSTKMIKTSSSILESLIYIKSDLGNPLSAISKVGASDFFEIPEEICSLCLQILSESILDNPIDSLAPSYIEEICSKVEAGDFRDAKWCFDLACNIGVRTKSDGLDASSLSHFFPETNFGLLLKELSRATLLVELNHGREAVIAIDKAIEGTKNLALTSQLCWSHLYQVKGDAAYQLSDQALARNAYERALEHSPIGSFNRAWASWRLGLLTNHHQSLRAAGEEFSNIGRIDYWARAWGAFGACLLKKGTPMKESSVFTN